MRSSFSKTINFLFLLVLVCVPAKFIFAGSVLCSSFFSIDDKSQIIDSSEDYISHLQSIVFASVRKLSSKSVKKPFALVKETYTLSESLAYELNQIYPEFPSIPMGKHYYYKHYVEGVGGVKSLTDEQFNSFKVTVNKGKLYNSKGEAINTGDRAHVYIIFNKNLYIAPERGSYLGKIKHATLGMGLPVMAAGEIQIKNGKLIQIDNFSGRYRLSSLHVKGAVDLLASIGVKTKKTKVRYIYARSKDFISHDDIYRYKKYGVHISKVMKGMSESGQKLLDKRMKRFKKVHKMSKSEIWEMYNFFFNWGPADDDYRDKITLMMFQSVKRSYELGFMRSYIEEVKYMIPYLNSRLIIRKLVEFSKSGINKTGKNRVASVIKKTAFLISEKY